MSLRDEIHTALGNYYNDYPPRLVDELVDLAVGFNLDLTAKRQAEVSEETDLDRWLGLWELLDRTSEGRVYDINLLDALEQLVTLIQPPSVRVARQVNAASEASSQT